MLDCHRVNIIITNLDVKSNIKNNKKQLSYVLKNGSLKTIQTLLLRKCSLIVDADVDQDHTQSTNSPVVSVSVCGSYF